MYNSKDVLPVKKAVKSVNTFVTCQVYSGLLIHSSASKAELITHDLMITHELMIAHELITHELMITHELITLDERTSRVP